MRSPSSPGQQMGAALTNENAARIASAMQFFRGFSDHVSLIACAREFVFGWLSAAGATVDRGRAIWCAAVALGLLHLVCESVIHASLGLAVLSVVSDDRNHT